MSTMQPLPPEYKPYTQPDFWEIDDLPPDAAWYEREHVRNVRLLRLALAVVICGFAVAILLNA